MTERDETATQPTQPKKGEPIEIPIPTREQFLSDLQKVAPPPPESPAEDDDEN